MPSKTFYTLLAAIIASAFVAASVSALVMFHIFEKYEPKVETVEGEQSAVLRYQLRGTNDAREYCYDGACTVHFQKGNGPECVAALSHASGREFTAITCNWKKE